MGLEGVDLGLDVLVALEEVVVAESDVVRLLPGHAQLVVDISEARLTLVDLGLQLAVPGVLILGLALQVRLLGQLAVQVSLERLGFYHEAGVLILSSGEIVDGGIEGLVGSSELKVLGVGKLREFVGSLLSLVEVVVDTFEFGVVILALALLEGDRVPEAVDLILVLSLLLAQLSQLVLQVVGVLTQSVDGVALGRQITLEGDALLLAPADLVADGADLGLVLVIGPVLLVGKEAQVLDLLAQRVGSHDVLVVPVVIVIILHKLLVLQVPVLLLNGIQLVPESQIVLVSLLDLEDLGLELGDEQVLLVAGQVH